MSLHANTLAYVDRQTLSLLWAVTLGFSPTARRLTEAGKALGSATRGQFEARIVSVSDIDIGYGDWRGGIETRTVTIEIEDGDNSFRDLLDGRYSFTLRGAPVTVELASQELAAGASPTDAVNDWIVCFTGVLDGWEQLASCRYRLRARTDDSGLQRLPSVPILNQSDAPNAVDYVKTDPPQTVGEDQVATAPVLGGAIPMVYGPHDSRALAGTTEGTTGAIPCRYLGEYPGSIFRYEASGGVMFHIERVLKDGVVVSTANWVRETFFAPSGFVMTVIKFTASQGTSVITCDGWGITSAMANPLAGAYEAAHPPLMRPTEIMEHILVNFGFFAWRGEASWFSRALTPLDPTSWDASKSFDATHAYEASLYIDEAVSSRKLVDIVTEFARANGKRLYWNQQGKLCIESRDRFAAGIYFNAPALIPADESPDFNLAEGITRRFEQSEDVEIMRRSYWRTAAQNATRGMATVYKPGIRTWDAKRTEQFDTIWACGRRFMDRTMLTPASQKMALVAFNIGFTGAAVTLDGGPIGSWTDSANALRTAYPVTQATGANMPTLRVGAVNGRAYVEFDGVNDVMTGTALSNLMSTSEFTLFVVFRVRSASANNAPASVFLNHPIVADSTGYFGLYVRVSAGVYYLQIALYDTAQRVAEIPISLDTWYVAKVAHFGGSITLTLTDQFALSAFVAAGNIGSLAGVISVGGNAVGGTPFAGDIAEVLMFSAGDISVQGATAGFVGGGAAFEIGHQLREDYGIAG